MNCLNNLIGIDKTCAGSTPVSGRYVQDLPGITLRIADAAVNEEGISGELLIRRKIESSQDFIVNDLQTFLHGKFNIASALENKAVGYYKQDLSTTGSESGKLKGFRIQIYEGPFLQLNIYRIGIKLTDTVDTSIFIYDLYNNKLLDTIPVSGVAGDVVYVTINEKYLTERQKLSLFICYDSSVSGAFNSTTNDSGRGCRNCGGRRYLSYAQSGYINSALSKIDANFVSSTTGNGLTIDYTVSCSIEPFVCSLSSLLSWPLLFKVGAELMMELKTTRRLNSIVTIDAGTNDEMYSYFQGEYEKSMNNLTSNLKLPDDVCFRCDKAIKRHVQIP